MRTYLRTLLNEIFKNNFAVIIIRKIVNFYCDFLSKTPNTIKFGSNMSIRDIDVKRSISFQSITGDKIDCK